MMELSQQVCSLELAKRLKELGVKQDSYFYYSYSSVQEEWQIHHFTHSFYSDYSAFTVAELSELLPPMINGCALEILRGYDFGSLYPMYCARYFNANLIGDADINMANACGKLFIYLIENGLVKI